VVLFCHINLFCVSIWNNLLSMSKPLTHSTISKRFTASCEYDIFDTCFEACTCMDIEATEATCIRLGNQISSAVACICKSINCAYSCAVVARCTASFEEVCDLYQTAPCNLTCREDNQWVPTYIDHIVSASRCVGDIEIVQNKIKKESSSGQLILATILLVVGSILLACSYAGYRYCRRLAQTLHQDSDSVVPDTIGNKT